MIWLLIFIPIVIGIIAVAKTYDDIAYWSKIQNGSGKTGAEIAEMILCNEHVLGIKIEEATWLIGDHYDPILRKLQLTEATYRGKSIVAMANAAHECGHAIQDSRNYTPIKLRAFIARTTHYGSYTLPFLIVLCIIFSTYQILAIVGFCFFLIVCANLFTLPVEFDASCRANLALHKLNLYTSTDERAGTSIILKAAAFTYVSTFITAITKDLQNKESGIPAVLKPAASILKRAIDKNKNK